MIKTDKPQYFDDDEANLVEAVPVIEGDRVLGYVIALDFAEVTTFEGRILKVKDETTFVGYRLSDHQASVGAVEPTVCADFVRGEDTRDLENA